MGEPLARMPGKLGQQREWLRRQSNLAIRLADLAPVAVGQAELQTDELRRLPMQGPERGPGIGGLSGGMAAAPRRHPEEPPDRHLVVDDQDMARHAISSIEIWTIVSAGTRMVTRDPRAGAAPPRR